MKHFLLIVTALLLVFVLSVAGIFGGWVDTYVTNKVEYIDQKIDDATNYDTRKTVEDSCRAMVASYEADKLTWMQYKDSDGEQRSWADQALMRANRTAANYNNYILKNSYVWDGNIPADICGQLPLLREEVEQ